MTDYRQFVATWVHRARTSRFVRAFGLVSGATAAGQVVALASVPLLSRVYSAPAFGEYGVFLAISAILSTLACLRLDFAIPRADHIRESEAIAFAGLLCAAVISGALLMLACVRSEPIAGIALTHVGLMLLPVSIFLGATWTLMHQLAIRKGRFRSIAARALIQPVVAFGVQGAWILFGVPGPGLIVGYIAGQGVAALWYLLDVRHSSIGSLRHLWSTVQAHRKYILIMTPQGVLNALNVQLPVLMISWLSSVETTGYFSMTQRVMGVPIGLIGMTMGQVYVSFLAERKSEPPEVAANLFARVSTALAIVGLALIVGSLFFALPLFELVLGPQWSTSAKYAQLASVMYAARLVAAPLGTTLVVMRQEAVQVKWDVLRLVVLLGCLALAWQLRISPTGFVALLTVGVTAAYAALWLLCRRALRSPQVSRNPVA